MTPEIPAKRKRGGQPGNQNSIGNRGNRTANRHKFARGNRLGARRGNRHALKQPTAPHVILLEDYKDCPLAVAWIQANAEALDQASFIDDNRRDRALYAVYRGLTIETIVRDGREYHYGLYSLIDDDVCQQRAA